MQRDQVWHAARASCGVLGVRRVLVIGSQAVWGSLDPTTEPPRATTLSAEADIAAIDVVVDHEHSAMALGAIGMGSTFHETNGYYVDGVEQTTATMPTGWESRVHRRVVGEDDHGPLVAWFPEIHDLVISKLAAGRPKDHRFVDALLDEGFIDGQLLTARIEEVQTWRPGEDARVRSWLRRMIT